MSRIIVKNLPGAATEDTIREFFAPKGTITDIRLLRKKDGTSRRFAFVGFKTDGEAAEAARYFDNAFMNMSRLSVQIAKALGDETLVTQHERRRRKREAAEFERRRMAKREWPQEEPKDEQFERYKRVMLPKKLASWQNEDGECDAASDESSDEDAVDMRDNSKHGAQDVPELEAAQEAIEDSKVERNVPEVSDGASDFDWLKARQQRIKENGEKPEPRTEEAAPPPPATQSASSAAGDSNTQTILQTGRLFIRNLSYFCTEDELHAAFVKFGEVKEVSIPLDTRTDKSKGIAYVRFEEPENALLAYENMDGRPFQGRLMHIIGARDKQAHELDEIDLMNMPVRKKRLLLKRQEASKAQFSWNSLYLNKDAVLDATAAKLGISKSELVDPHSSSMAVKQALSESSMLQSIQNYFRNKGIDLAAFDTRETTDKVILVKNLPFNTQVHEIASLFHQCGEIERLLMPPEGAVAIIQFKSSSAGQNAFTTLAYRRLGNSILYLQKAPLAVLKELESKNVASESLATAQPVEILSAADVLEVAPETEELDAAPRSLYVKNLSFSTSVDGLSALFKPLDGFVGAQIKTRPDAKHPGRVLSMGYGFIEFRTGKQALVASKSMTGAVLDGHKLEIKLSSHGMSAAKTGPGAKKAANSTKIVVKNVPFEVTRKDLQELFGTFGKLRSVRLPRKFDKQSRGFAFVEYSNSKDAQHAMTSLAGTHLLGRRLVLQFAAADAEDPEAEIEAMEKKVRRQVDAEALASAQQLAKFKPVEALEGDDESE